MEREINTTGNKNVVSSITVSSLADHYFNPKGFERDGKFYERLGIRWFKRHLPYTGDIIMRKKGIKQIENSNYEALASVESITRVVEQGHWGVGLLFIAATAFAAYEQALPIVVFTTGANILINLYPIMLQRYNRSRLYRAMDRALSRESTSSTSKSE